MDDSTDHDPRRYTHYYFMGSGGWDMRDFSERAWGGKEMLELSVKCGREGSMI